MRVDNLRYLNHLDYYSHFCCYIYNIFADSTIVIGSFEYGNLLIKLEPSQVRKDAPEEGRRLHRPKRSEHNKNECSSPNDQIFCSC